MNALVIKHIDCEGPGVLGDVFASHGVDVTLAHPYRAEPLPSVAGHDFLVVLGGPMGVYERGRYAFIDAEAELVRQAVSRDIPTLGICLGSQIIAHALGGHVTRHSVKEIGAMTVTLTPDGLADPLFHGLDPLLPVFQWHGDTFSLPAGAVRLAASSVTPNQAFRYGRRTYGVQFHLEVTLEMVTAWLAEYAAEVANERLDPEVVGQAAAAESKRWAEVSDTVFSRFVALAREGATDGTR
jgi:GMP synthase-like glutamine amidotransferase